MDFGNFLDVDFDYLSSEEEIKMDSKCEDLLDNIQSQIRHIEERGFKAEYILMNIRNYERIIAYMAHVGKSPASTDVFEGCQIVLWDVPVDYVNVRCKASDEWAYGESIRKGASK